VDKPGEDEDDDGVYDREDIKKEFIKEWEQY
jgi:hypothetical protein